MAFKVGDKVFCRKPENENEGPCWASPMDDGLNKLGTVTYGYAGQYGVDFGLDREYTYLEGWLLRSFNVGDKVRIKRPSSQEERRQTPCWVPDMDGTDGKTGIVEVVKDYYARVRVSSESETWNYRFEYLTLVDIDEEKFLDFKPGDKVRVHRPETEEEREVSPTWSPGMDQLDGKVGIIIIQSVESVKDNAWIPISFRSRGTWYFHPTWVSHLETEEPEELSEQAKEDLQIVLENGIFSNIKLEELPIFEDLVFEFAGSLEIRNHAFTVDEERLIKDMKACVFKKPDVSDEKKRRIRAKYQELYVDFYKNKERDGAVEIIYQNFQKGKVIYIPKLSKRKGNLNDGTRRSD